MTKHVFVSHAGADTPTAMAIAEQLTDGGLEVTIDREELRGGDSFLSFMEKALSTCDYCLLLWSKAASEGKYVQVEWEAALYKTIEESRRFLLIARLEDYPLPALLGPLTATDTGVGSRRDTTARNTSFAALSSPTTPRLPRSSSKASKILGLRARSRQVSQASAARSSRACRSASATGTAASSAASQASANPPSSHSCR